MKPSISIRVKHSLKLVFLSQLWVTLPSTMVTSQRLWLA